MAIVAPFPLSTTTRPTPERTKHQPTRYVCLSVCLFDCLLALYEDSAQLCPALPCPALPSSPLFCSALLSSLTQHLQSPHHHHHQPPTTTTNHHQTKPNETNPQPWVKSTDPSLVPAKSSPKRPRSARIPLPPLSVYASLTHTHTHTGRAPREAQAAKRPRQEADPVRPVFPPPRLSTYLPSYLPTYPTYLPGQRLANTYIRQVHAPIRQRDHDGRQEEDEPQPRNLSAVQCSAV